MQHPDELRLQSYLDGELEEDSREHVRAHVAICPRCRDELHGWKSLQTRLRESAPNMAAFSSEGEFWSRLVGRLPLHRRATWPVVSYLPPLLLGGVGTLIEGLISVLFALHGLISLRIVPSIGELFPAAVAYDPTQAGWLDSVYGWLGLSMPNVAQRWAGMSWVDQDTAMFVALLLLLAASLSVVVVLFLSWAVCWSEPARADGNGGM